MLIRQVFKTQSLSLTFEASKLQYKQKYKKEIKCDFIEQKVMELKDIY
jgi:hypothetical protein